MAVKQSAAGDPLVSIVIVNWNGLADTRVCLQHVRRQTYKHLEIIVVDNGSTDGSAAYLRKQKDVKLVENPKNLGFTGGHIPGYRATSGEYIVLLNNDAVMEPGYIARAVAYITKDSQIGALGGRAYLWDDSNPLFKTTNAFYAYQNINPITAEGIFAQEDEGVPREVNNVSGSCVMVRRSVIDQIGYLHDPFFAYYEESDLFGRMKRGGYKVVYHPELAIWHGNGKTAGRLGSTFGYYMMMRNRFRFAVRNFDGWALRRFLKFYLKKGAGSTARALLPGNKYPIERAYSKAFWYNVLWGWRAFVERRALSRSLPKSPTYNKLVVREQTGVSVVVTCRTKATIDECVKLAESLQPIDEVIMVVSTPALIQYARRFATIHSDRLRLCIDRQFFAVQPANLGIICAKNEWLVLPQSTSSFKDIRPETIRQAVALTRGRRHQLVYISQTKLNNPEQAAYADLSDSMLISRELALAAGGLHASLSHSDALRALLAYAVIAKRVVQLPAKHKVHLPIFNDKKTPFANVIPMMQAALREHTQITKKETVFDRFLARHYRFQQAFSLWKWTWSPRVTMRLKLARLKNVVLFTALLQRKRLATELKHIRNELLLNSYTLAAAQSHEITAQKRLQHRIKQPEDTTVFVITRDRFDALKELLIWLKRQGLSRIVFIDNDSLYPPLVDFLQKTDYQVLEMRRNPGHTVAWSSGIIKLLLPNDFYLLTDPDVIPTRTKRDVLPFLYRLHDRFPAHLKIGLGLVIDDLPDTYKLKHQVIEWERQFWKHPVADNVYGAGVDTTFALYKPRTYQYFIHPSLRTGEPYTARHLPWYSDSNNITEEDKFYRLRADQNVNTWNKETLPERYVKELARSKRTKANRIRTA